MSEKDLFSDSISLSEEIFGISTFTSDSLTSLFKVSFILLASISSYLVLAASISSYLFLASISSFLFLASYSSYFSLSKIF